MTRSDYLAEILPEQYSFSKIEPAGPKSRNIYNNKKKDIQFIKRVTREKVNLDGAPILYFPINPESNNSSLALEFDNDLKDHTHLELGEPIEMKGTWTPQEYQMDLSKWGIMMPGGSDNQIFIHVDELEEKLKRKPLIGDIIETVMDRTRYKISDVYFGHTNLWENIFCMVSLTKVTYDDYTSQLDEYDETYKDTYTKLEKVLDIMDGSEHHKTNADIQTSKRKTDSHTKTKPRKKSIDTALDIMTMSL